MNLKRIAETVVGVTVGVVLANRIEKKFFTEKTEEKAEKNTDFDDHMNELKSFMAEKFYDLAKKFDMNTEEDGSENPAQSDSDEDNDADVVDRDENDDSDIDEE